jgi:hypothetical protein
MKNWELFSLFKMAVIFKNSKFYDLDDFFVRLKMVADVQDGGRSSKKKFLTLEFSKKNRCFLQ